MKLMTGARLSAAIALAAGVAMGFAIVGSASAAPAGQGPAAKAPAKMVTHHFALSAAAFAPDGLHTTSEDYFNEWDPSALSNQDSGRCFNTGLQIPAGVTLESVTAYYTAGSAAMYFEVSRQDLVNHTSAAIASFDSAANAGSPAYTSMTVAVLAADAVVNMKTYAYSVGVCPVGNTTFSGLVITYSQPVTS